MKKSCNIYIAVGKKYALVPEALAVAIHRVDKTCVIVGGKYDGMKVSGVTGAADRASFFKGCEKITFEELL